MRLLPRPTPCPRLRAGDCLPILGVLVGLLFAPPVAAQPSLDVPALREHARSLSSNFWETAWVGRLAAEAGRDGTVDWAYAERRQVSELTDEYQRAIGEADGFWTHLQVQDYLQRRLLAGQPNPMMSGRPGVFRLRVLSTTTPNALALDDGTILLTTGLLTSLETEAQLRAATRSRRATTASTPGPKLSRHASRSSRCGARYGREPATCTPDVGAGIGAQRGEARLRGGPHGREQYVGHSNSLENPVTHILNQYREDGGNRPSIISGRRRSSFSRSPPTRTSTLCIC